MTVTDTARARIAAAMSIRNLTQEAVALAAKDAGHTITQGQLSKILSGKQSVGLDSGKALAGVLGLPITDLVPELASLLPATGIMLMPWRRFWPSPRNPRRYFDEEALDGLAENIAIEGIHIPLLVRYANRPGNTPVDGALEGDLEIIGGERRHRACGKLIQSSRAAPDDPLPFKLIDPCADDRYDELVLSENVARNDMTPLEQARLFQRLVMAGRSTATIGAIASIGQRAVQKRLRLLKDLHPRLVQELEDGGLTVEYANVLASQCPEDFQLEVLAMIQNGGFSSADELEAWLRRRLEHRQQTEERALHIPEGPVTQASADLQARQEAETPLPFPEPVRHEDAAPGREDDEWEPVSAPSPLLNVPPPEHAYESQDQRVSDLIKTFFCLKDRPPMAALLGDDLGGDDQECADLREAINDRFSLKLEKGAVATDMTVIDVMYLVQKAVLRQAAPERRKPSAKLPYEVSFPSDEYACVGVMWAGDHIQELWLENRRTGKKTTFVPNQRDIEDAAE